MARSISNSGETVVRFLMAAFFTLQFSAVSVAFAAVPKSTKLTNAAATTADSDAMVDALAKEDFARAKKLHKKGVSYDSLSSSDDMTGLMRLADDGTEQAVSDVLALGANVNGKNSAGESALWYATYSGHEKLALSLIARGASAEGQRPDSHECLMHMAVQADLAKLSAKLMKLTPKCASIKDIDGHTPAAVAKSLGYKKIAKLVTPKG
jgi:ankyrin repeat protein